MLITSFFYNLLLRFNQQPTVDLWELLLNLGGDDATGDLPHRKFRLN